MKISREAAVKLKNDLPSGYWKELQQRILQNHGKEYKRSMIYAVLNPDNPRESDLILDEAIAYRKELLKIKAAREAAILC